MLIRGVAVFKAAVSCWEPFLIMIKVSVCLLIDSLLQYSSGLINDVVDSTAEC